MLIVCFLPTNTTLGTQGVNLYLYNKQANASFPFFVLETRHNKGEFKVVF